MDVFETEVLKTLTDDHMVAPGDLVVMGVSGGPDSVALCLSLLAVRSHLELDLCVAHLNHHLRGAEANEDASFVEGLARELGLPMVMGEVDEDPPRANLEDWARLHRYRFLARVARERGAARIAVGHQADDVCETLLINLIRGAGSSGLSGIGSVRPLTPLEIPEEPDLRVAVIRPLIRLHREDVIDYLDRMGRSYRQDSSNFDPRFLRNQVRSELMPLLEKLNPGIRKVLVRTAAASRREANLIQESALEWLENHSYWSNGVLRAETESLLDKPAGFRLAVYREALRMVAGSLLKIGSVHLEAVDRLVNSGRRHGELNLPGLAIHREYDLLYFMKEEDRRDLRARMVRPGELRFEVPGELNWPGLEGVSFKLTCEVCAAGRKPRDPFQEVWLDIDSIDYPLAVRPRLPGDRYRPVGFNGSRKVKKILNELQVPPSYREIWPIVTDQKGIVWVPGCRASDRAFPRSGDHFLKLTVSPRLPGGPNPARRLTVQ